MKLEIRHQLRFQYSRPVFIEPIIIRLRPRSDCHQQLLDFQLQVEPGLAGCVDMIDLDGNNSLAAWFDGLHSSLVINASSRVETRRENPFDFILTDPGADRIPLAYPESLQDSLLPYLKGASEQQVSVFARETLNSAEGRTLPFLMGLTQKIHEDFEWCIREKGEPLTARETLVQKQGACRDLAVLFMECCRSVGLAARFVSGYGPWEKQKNEHPYLHAWTEVYLPGGGWRGYDPTQGLAVGDGYVALAAGPCPELAAPTSGAFRGTGAESHLDYDLKIEIVP